ncbi:MAG: sulfate adenylyltransferase [Campylobacterales bacterium]|nr:sulfate adenylyltransferase [Campylobacterales bacterium]
MASTKRNKSLFIDKEAVASLSLVQEGILRPVEGLMGSADAKKVDDGSLYKGKSFPFSFLLAPSGKRNKDVLESLKKGESINLVENHNIVGHLDVEEVFEIDPMARVEKIYGTRDMSHPGVANTLSRLGKYAISGKYEVDFDDVKKAKAKIDAAKKRIDAKHVAGMVMAARPLNRAHERLIRLTLEKNDLVVIFLSKPYSADELSYAVRYEALEHLVNTYFPADRVVIVPFENTYLFAGRNELLLDAIAIQNFGCDSFVIGANHAGLGMFYESHEIKSIFDSFVGVELKIDISSHFVYCNVCKTLVTQRSCPHGMHHHINFNTESLLELLKTGLLPPAILMRKDVSAIYLSRMFPNRFKNLGKLYNDLTTNSGLIEEHSEREFYNELMSLYQTTSLN